MREYLSRSVDETEAIAASLAKELHRGDVIAYTGTLGAGKTAFTRGLAKGLGTDGDVSSPTFALVHEYAGNPPLYHFDMYRITGLDDVYSTGYFDYLDQNGIIAIEWSENVPEILDENTIYIELTNPDNNDPDCRRIIIKGGDRF